VINRRSAQLAISVAAAVVLALAAVQAGTARAEDSAAAATNVAVESNTNLLAVPLHPGVPTGSTIPPGGHGRREYTAWAAVFVLGFVAIILLAYLQKRRVKAYRMAAEQDKLDARSKSADDDAEG
jgi:hypothetical protein